MQETKLKLKLKRTPLLRLAALVLAAVMIGVLAYSVNSQMGNPISAWYTARKIAAHYNTYHPGEGYVVGPAQYTYVGIDNNIPAKMRYVSHVYKKGSVDTGFLAVFQDGAVIQCENATTKSGTNTYNRFKNALNAELTDAGVRDTLGLQWGDTLFADFYEPDITRDMFNPASPVFLPDAPYDRNKLPVKSVVCMMQDFADATQVTDETLASTLYHLKKTCEDAGLPFDVYSAQLYPNSLGYTLQAMDVPAAELATPEKAAAYVADMNESEKTGPLRNADAIAVAARKIDWLYSKSQFEVCAH